MKNKVNFNQSVFRANSIIILLLNLIYFINSTDISSNNHQYRNQFNQLNQLDQFNQLNQLDQFNRTIIGKLKKNDKNQTVNVLNLIKLSKQSDDDSKMLTYQASYHRPKYEITNYEKSYQKLKTNLHNQIKSNIKLFNNRKFVKLLNRGDEDSTTGDDDETNKIGNSEEKYNNEDDDSKKTEIDYDVETKSNKNENTETKQQELNEKTDYKSDYESPSDTGEEKDYKEDYKEDYKTRKINNSKTEDYDAKTTDDETVNMSEDDNLKDEDIMDDKIKDDEENTFKNEDKLDNQNRNSINNEVAIRFSPSPKYSKPFEPLNKLKYNSIDDPNENFKDNSKDSYSDSPANDRPNESSKSSEDNMKDNSKEINYSVFDLNRINLRKDQNKVDNFEKHEELLIELLKRRFLNNQKRMLELKKREKRRQFLNEIDESFSLRKLNEEAVKYAMIESKLNRLINLIQEQQQQRDMNRFISHPMAFSSFSGNPESKLTRSYFPKKSHYNRLNFKPLFSSDVNFYPKNRFSFSRPKISSGLSSPDSHSLNWPNEMNNYPPNTNYGYRPDYSNHKSHYIKSNYFRSPNYNSVSPSNSLNNALNSAISNALGYPSNHPSIKRYPIYKFIKPIEQSVEHVSTSSTRKPNLFNERLNNLSLNSLSLNLNSLLGGGSGTKQHSSTPSLITTILQPTESDSFRKLSSIKYRYHLLHNLQPSIPLKMFSDRSSKDHSFRKSKDNKIDKNVISIPRLGGIMFDGSGYSSNQR